MTISDLQCSAFIIANVRHGYLRLRGKHFPSWPTSAARGFNSSTQLCTFYLEDSTHLFWRLLFISEDERLHFKYFYGNYFFQNHFNLKIENMLEWGERKENQKTCRQIFSWMDFSPSPVLLFPRWETIQPPYRCYLLGHDLLHVEVNASHDSKLYCWGPGKLLLSTRWGGSLSQSNQVLYELPSWLNKWHYLICDCLWDSGSQRQR